MEVTHRSLSAWMGGGGGGGGSCRIISTRGGADHVASDHQSFVRIRGGGGEY